MTRIQRSATSNKLFSLHLYREVECMLAYLCNVCEQLNVTVFWCLTCVCNNVSCFHQQLRKMEHIVSGKMLSCLTFCIYKH